MRTISLLLLSTMLAAACGGERAASDADGAAPAADTSARAANTDVASGAAAVVRAELAGGAGAGVYNVEARDPICTADTTQRDAWSVRWRDDTASTGLTSVRVVVPGAKGAAGERATFHASVIVGPFMQGADYTIETRPGEERRGSGTATVADSAGTARIAVRGTTADGVGLDLVVQCNRVERP